MTWRPTQYLIEGELDNTTPGRVTGWLRFAGMDQRVELELEGDFLADVRSRKLTLNGRYGGSKRSAQEGMKDFRAEQHGQAGWITAGGVNEKNIDHPYIEWYSDGNGRVVLMPEAVQVAISEASRISISTEETAN